MAAEEIAHDASAARRAYADMPTPDLVDAGRGFLHDGKGTRRTETAYFALERLWLIVDVLAERAERDRKKIRRLELELEKRPPAVRVVAAPGVTK